MPQDCENDNDQGADVVVAKARSTPLSAARCHRAIPTIIIVAISVICFIYISGYGTLGGIYSSVLRNETASRRPMQPLFPSHGHYRAQPIMKHHALTEHKTNSIASTAQAKEKCLAQSTKAKVEDTTCQLEGNSNPPRWSPTHNIVQDNRRDAFDRKKGRPLVLPLDGTHNNNYVHIKTWPLKRDAYYIVACTMIRNKARYVPEWIEFHLLQGFDRFVIYDDRSTDGLREIIDPYIRTGVVEYLRWPEDADKIAAPPTGPRVFQNDWQKEDYTRHMQRCIVRPPNGVPHAHNGCQMSATLDALARYRGRTAWIVHFDIDEYFFIHHQYIHRNVVLSDIVTVRDVLEYQYHQLDHIRVTGRIFGTNGFMEEPAAESPNLPFPLVFDQYRYCQENSHARYQERVLFDRAYTEKSFVKPEFASSTVIHFWTFENKTEVPRESHTIDGLMTMNHYRFRGIMQQKRKALENNYAKAHYNRAADVFYNEVKDYTIGYLTPLVRHNLRQRIKDGMFRSLPSPVPRIWTPTRKPYIAGQKVNMCIAFVHFAAELPKFRKSVHTLMHYLNIAEPSVSYKVVGVSNYHKLVGEERAESNQYGDFKMLFDALEIYPDSRTLAQLTDRATEMCGNNTEFILYMEDVWETRFRDGGVADAQSTVVQQPVFLPAMELMRQDKRILEVWVGDTPNHPVYTETQSKWLNVPAKVIEVSKKETEAASKAQKAPTPKIGNNKTNASVVSSPPLWYRIHTGKNKTSVAVTRLGGTLRHRQRQAQVGTWVGAATSKAFNGTTESTKNDAMSLAARFGSLASNHGFVSAHFCFANSTKSNPACGLDPDGRSDTQTTTGIMWRQHLVLNGDERAHWFSDRVPFNRK